MFEFLDIALLFGAIGLVIFCVPTFALAWGADYSGFAKLALFIPLAVAVVLAWEAVRIFLICSADPIFVPSENGLPEDGRFILHCDGPAGFGAFLFSYIMAPVSILTLLFIVRKFWRKYKLMADHSLNKVGL